MLIKNSSNKLPVAVDERRYHREQKEHKALEADHRSLEGMLKVEGRQARQEHENERRGRDIKAELQKIYNLRNSPHKSAVRQRVIQLPRIK